MDLALIIAAVIVGVAGIVVLAVLPNHEEPQAADDVGSAVPPDAEVALEGDETEGRDTVVKRT